MQHLLTRDGLAALARLMARRPLLAFDFDGTLAAIVARPDRARVSPPVSKRLTLLSTQLPVAIVTGRSVADVVTRLGFEPRYLVGNHGAEDPVAPERDPALHAALQPLRAQLQARGAELAAAGLTVEDKGASIALHYRLSSTPERALVLAHALVDASGTGLHVFGGKCVLNVASVHAPDKAMAVHDLLQRSGAPCALFAGDDTNDEPVFAAAAPDWLTIRVGHAPQSQARYYLDSPVEMALALEAMVGMLPEPPA